MHSNPISRVDSALRLARRLTFVPALILGGTLISARAQVGPLNQSPANISPKKAVALYQIVGRTTGQPLAPTARTTLTSQSSGNKAQGRVTALSRASFDTLTRVQKDDIVVLPLTDGTAIGGTINLTLQENGSTRVAGPLDNGAGSFFLSSNGKDVSGLIQLVAEGIAYRIEQSGTGEVVLREVPRDEVICVPQPALKTSAPAGVAAPNITVPLLNSRPSVVAQLYLDFDGETVTDPAWDNGNTIVAPPQNLSELEITAIFNRVKEDWWPFNINVTTSLQKYNAAPAGSRMRVIITTNNQAAPGAGGVAYIDSFSKAGRAFTANVPAWVFNGGIEGVSETISHELGHTVGLRHDGRAVPGQPPETYFKGHGSGPTSWGPLMGGSFRQSVTQWSKGEYQFADQSSREDELAIITNATNGFGYVPDEAGNSRAAATALNIANGNVSFAGVISNSADSDFFSFSTTGGRVTINATGAQPSANLDIALELQNASGGVVASANPPADLSANLSADVPAGNYFLKVVGSGAGDPFTNGYSNYASMGAYNLGGTVPGGGGGGGNRPNVTGYKPNDWADKIVVSKVTGTRTDDTPLLATDSLFVDFAILNDGTAEAPAGFLIELYIDDVLKQTYTANPIPPNFFTAVTDYAAGTLPAGSHTFRVKLDPTNVLSETSENDNEYSKTVLISGGTASNDSFASPRVLSGSRGSVTDTNTAATKESGEPAHAGNAGGKSLWYQWTAPANLFITFDTLGSDFDTLLAVYVGNSLGALNEVASNDDAANDVRASSLSFAATQGTTYRIAIDGYRAAAGNIVLNFDADAPAVTSFTPGAGTVGTQVTIFGARFLAATDVRFNGVAAAFQVLSDTQITATVPPGATTGPISVSSLSGTGTSASAFTVAGGVPSNDLFANAATINGGETTVTGSSLGASKESGEPAHAGEDGGASVWWRWTAPESRSYIFSTAGSNFDTLLAVYTGSSVSGLASVVANDDDTSGGLTSKVILNAASGQTYFIAVDGYGGLAGSVSLSVKPNLPSQTQLANISTRLNVGTGENVLIGGFIVTGNDAKNVILRAIGPSLSIPGRLNDPTLELYDQNAQLVFANDDWESSQPQEIIATGIPPTDPLESAMLVVLEPGAYTAILGGFNDATGIAVVEAYDLDATGNSTLANIATRGIVQRGDNVMIGGVIVRGQGVKRVLLRAIGPSLGAFGVAGAISDPTLELFDRNGNAIYFNDDWRDSQEAAIIGTGIPPLNELESAIVAELNPDAYTAVMRGFNNAVGVGLVEVYDID